MMRPLFAALGLGLLIASSAPVAATPAGPDLRFVLIGDRTGSHTPGVYERVIEQIEFLRPAFVVSVGDHIEGYTEEESTLTAQWTEFHELAGRFTVPFHYCPGNHDITTDGMLPAYRKATGLEPCYSFDHAGIHFVILDTSRWETSADWIAKSGYVDWLRGDLEQHRGARLTVVVYHKPYWYATLAEGLPDPMHEIFRAHGVDYVFNGHFHNYGAARYDGIRYTIIGSSGGGIDGEDPDRGMFFQFAWCAVRSDTLDWMVMKSDGLLARDEISIADEKLLDQIESRFLRPGLFIDPGRGSEGVLTYNVLNPQAEPWDCEIHWEESDGWKVHPSTGNLALAGGAGAGLAFSVERTGAFYPLPKMWIDFPYRTGRAYKHEGALPVRRAQLARPVRSAPAIDGSLDEACWDGAPSAEEFGSPEGGPTAIEPTRISFLYDEQNLYVAARCTQREASLTLAAQERDGNAFRDDCVGFFLCPDTSGAVAYQLYWNAAGVQFDQRLPRVSPGNYSAERDWNLACRSAAQRTDEEWRLEAAIPFAELNTHAPKTGDHWRINFRRKEIAAGVVADWQAPIDYNPATYGVLVFE